jgi:hypothetical protein
MSGSPSATRTDAGAQHAPISERVPDAVCVAFALWTLCAHGVIVAGGNLHHLLAGAALTGGAAVLAVAWLRRRSPPRPGATPQETTATSAPAFGLRVVAFALGVTALVVYSGTRDLLVLWWSAVALLAAAGAVVLRTPPALPRPSRPSRRAEAFLWSLGITCAVLTLVVHRFDIDDAFYANIAVAAADDPSRALYSMDTLLGIPDLPLHNPAQRVLSLELLNAAVSWITGLPALLCLHLLSAGFAALLIPLCQARLYRQLLPGPPAWIAAVLATSVVLLVAGDTHRSFGNYAFVRLWQGKAIFLTIALPLTYAYAIRFSASGALGDWLRLAAAQVASVGLTSTAIWAAPLAGGLGLASQFRTDARGVRIFLRGIGACLYPIAVGLALRGSVSRAVEVESASYAPGAWLADSFARILGTQHFELVALAAMLLLFACARSDALRRFAIFVPLGALLTVANPYLEEWVRSLVTGPSHWRCVWAIPVPLLLGLLIATPLSGDAIGGALRVRAACFAVLVLAFALFVPHATPFSQPGADRSFESRPWSARGRFPHHVRFGTPGPKVDPLAFRFATLLAKAVPADARVVAPEAVSLWIGTLHDAPHPVSDRHLYMKARRRLLGNEEVKRRNALTNFAANPVLQPHGLRRFQDGLRAYDIRAILIRPRPGDGALRQLLRAEGFQLRKRSDILDLWVRSSPKAASPPDG